MRALASKQQVSGRWLVLLRSGSPGRGGCKEPQGGAGEPLVHCCLLYALVRVVRHHQHIPRPLAEPPSLLTKYQVGLAHVLGIHNVFNRRCPAMRYRLRMYRADEHDIAWQVRLKLIRLIVAHWFSRFCVLGSGGSGAEGRAAPLGPLLFWVLGSVGSHSFSRGQDAPSGKWVLLLTWPLGTLVRNQCFSGCPIVPQSELQMLTRCPLPRPPLPAFQHGHQRPAHMLPGLPSGWNSKEAERGRQGPQRPTQVSRCPRMMRCVQGCATAPTTPHHRAPAAGTHHVGGDERQRSDGNHATDHVRFLF